MCVVCVQVIASDRREQSDPSTSAGRRAELEELVQATEPYLQHYKLGLAQTEAELASTAAALLPQGKFT